MRGRESREKKNTLNRGAWMGASALPNQAAQRALDCSYNA